MNSNIQETQSQKQKQQSAIQKTQVSRKQTNPSSLNVGNGRGQSSTSKNIDISKIEENKYKDEEQKKHALKMNKQFTYKNFDIIIDLLKFRKSSIEKAYIQVLFAFICLYISNIRVYRDLVDQYYTVDSGNLSTVIAVLSYLEFTTVLKFNITAYQILFFLSAAFIIMIPVLYITCYFMYSSNQMIKVRKFFYGRWLVYAGEYFTWIFLQPCYLTLMSYITCYQPIATSLKMVCDSTDSLYPIKISLAALALFIGFINTWFLSVFFFNGGFSNKKDSLSCDNTIHIFSFNLYRIVFSVMICLRYNSYIYFIIFLLVNVLFSAYLAYQFILNSGLLTFRNKYIRDLFKILIIILFAQNVAFLIDEFQRNLNLIGVKLSENSSQFTVIMSVIFYFVFRKISKNQEHYLIMGNELKGCSYGVFKKRIYYLQHLLESAQESVFQDVYFKGIISQHLNNPCFHQESHSQKCFCQMRYFHDSKKNKDVNIDRCYYSINKNIFCKFIIKSWYIQFIQLNPHNYTAIIDYSEFIFNKMRNSCLSLQNAIFLKKKYIYPFDQFRFFRLIHYIHKVNRKKNITAYKSVLNVENVIPIEQKIDRIKYKIRQILNQNIDFWNMLLKNVINLEELNLAIKKIFGEIDEIKKMWIRVVVYLNYRKKWRFYYAWYYLYILNQKVLISLLERFSGSIINENEIFVEEYQTDQVEDDVGSVISNAKDDQDKINIKKIEMAFDRRSCVFRVGSDIQGKIIKVNKPVLTTFGFSRHELENHVHITDLMPKTIAIQHPKYTSNFIATGKSKVIYSQKKVFCVMKKGNVFAAWKFLKLFVTLQGETEFVSLIRPILNPAGSKMNYIIFNDDWEIDAMTSQMYEYFMIDSELYRQQMTLMANIKNKKDKHHNDGIKVENKISIQTAQQNGMVLNILLIIPKLIKFSKLVQFLTNDDQQHFGIIQKKENLGDIASLFNKGKKENTDAKQMQRIKQMTAIKRTQAQKSLAAKKVTQTQEELDSILQQIPDDSGKNSQRQSQLYKITNGKGEELDAQNKKKNIFRKEEEVNQVKGQPRALNAANNGVNLTINQDDSIGQLLTVKQKNRENFEEITAASPKSNQQIIANIKNQNFQKQYSSMSGNSRQSSMQDIQEQMLGDIQQQELIRKQIDKAPHAYRRKTLNQLEQNDEMYDEEDEKTNKGDQDSTDEDDDIESDYGMDIVDSNGKKIIDERLEKGEQLRLVARVPYNINQLMQSYYTMAMSRLKKFDSSEKTPSNQQQPLKETNKMRTFTHNSHLTFKDSATNLSFKKHDTQTEKNFTQREEQENQNQRDKAFYQLIKDAYTLHVKRKKTRQFKFICTTKFKKIGTRKIGIMKIHNLEEIKFQKMMLLQQIQNTNKEYSLSKQLSGCKQDSDQMAVPTSSNVIQSAQKEQTLKPTQLKNALLSNIRNQLLPQSSQISGIASINDFIGDQQQDSRVQENDAEVAKNNGMGYQLDNFEENRDEDTIKDIQKDFEKKQGSVTFSLNSVDNIFIKEDIHQPKQQLNSIFQLQLFTRLVFIFILLFNIFTYFLGVNTYLTTISSQVILIPFLIHFKLHFIYYPVRQLKENIYDFGILIIFENLLEYKLELQFKQKMKQKKSERVSLIKELNLEILNGYDNMLDQLLLNDGSYQDSMLSKAIYKNRQGMQDEISSTLYNITNYFQILMVDSNFQQTLFDTGVNASDTVTTQIINQTPTKGNYSFDVFDMFQQYIYHVNELNNSMISSQEIALITLDNPDVDFIRKNVFEYLNHHVYEQGQTAIDIVTQTMTSIQSFILIITIILSVLVGVSFIYMWRLMSAICVSFTSIFDSFEKIDYVDVRKIANYYQIILHQFSYAVDKDEFYSRAYMPITNQLMQESEIYESKVNEEDQINNAQISQIKGAQPHSAKGQATSKTEQTRATIEAVKNSRVAAALLKVSDLQLEASDDNAQVKKNKIIENGAFLRDLKVKILTFYLLFTFSVICFSSVYIIQVYLNQQTLEKMREDGLVFINPITLNYVMLISVKENALDPLFYQQQLYPSAKSYIDLFFALKQDTILNDLSLEYNTMYNQVYKNDTCYSDVAYIILPQAWIDDCATIVQKALLGGLNIFGTKFTEFVQPFKTLSALQQQLPSSTMYDDIIQYSRGIYYANIFNLKIMKVWTTDVVSNLNSIITFCTVLVIVASILILILYAILNEYYIIGRLRTEYDFFRSVYKMYFPEAIITKKKNIKFWLIKQGILKRK